VLTIKVFKKQQARIPGPAKYKILKCVKIFILSDVRIHLYYHYHCRHDSVVKIVAVAPACDSYPETIDVVVAAVD